MRQSHILILPSFFEGLPLVVLEGLACECRIVATNLPGTKELLGDSNADFVSLVRTPRLRSIDRPYPEDEKSFEHNLKQAIQGQMVAASERPQIDGSLIQDRIDSFAWTGIFKKVREAYSSCLKEDPNPSLD